MMMGFTCKWSHVVKAVNTAPGPMAAVRRLHHFIHTKDYMRGGVSAADTLNRVNHYINETLGKSNTAFTHEDGQQRDRMVFKELMKFLAAFEVLEALPREFNDIKSNLELSIAEAVDKSSMYFTTWMINANANAITKGHAVMYREKILSPLSVARGKYEANTTTVAAISEEAKKKFLTSWKDTTIDIDAANKRKLEIKEVIKPMISEANKTKVVKSRPSWE